MLYPKYWEILILGYFCKHRAGEQIYICSPAGWERENSNLDWSIIVKFTLSLFFLAQNALIPSFPFVLQFVFIYYFCLSSFFLAVAASLVNSSSSSSRQQGRAQNCQNRSANSRSVAARNLGDLNEGSKTIF